MLFLLFYFYNFPYYLINISLFETNFQSTLRRTRTQSPEIKLLNVWPVLHIFHLPCLWCNTGHIRKRSTEKLKLKTENQKTSVDLEPFKNIPQKCLVNKEDYIISLLSGSLNNYDPHILFKLIKIMFLCRKICKNI